MERGGTGSRGGQVQSIFLARVLAILSHMLFQRKVSKDFDAEIAAAEEALAHAHKAL